MGVTMMIPTPTRAALAAVLALALGAGSMAEAGGGTTRYYTVATPAMAIATIPPYFSPAPMFSFVVDQPGTVTGIHLAPTADINGSMDDRVVGSLWVNASNGPTIDDLFCICAPVPAMRRTQLAAVGMPNTTDMPVNAGDVVTVLLGDEQSGAPPVPAATWVLEVSDTP